MTKLNRFYPLPNQVPRLLLMASKAVAVPTDRLSTAAAAAAEATTEFDISEIPFMTDVRSSGVSSRIMQMTRPRPSISEY